MENIGKITLADRFSCKICKYNTNHKSHNNHLLSMKHLNRKKLETQNSDSCQKDILSNKIYSCNICNKQYNTNSGLYKHNKKCKLNNKINTDEFKQILINEVKNHIINNEIKNNEEQLKFQLLQNKYYELKLFLITNKEKINQNGLEIPIEFLN